jgi:hypothetical protein
MNNYLVQIRTWSGKHITNESVTAESYMQVLKQLKEQYTNHRYTLLGVTPSLLCVNCD